MMRYMDEIIVHCTATPPDWRAGQPASRKVAKVRLWHVEVNWDAIQRAHEDAA